jgi:hypothetical protein
MATKRMLADVLWTAANKHLASSDEFYNENTTTATCCAAYWADMGYDWRNHPGYWRDVSASSKAVRFLGELGCPVDSSDSFAAFSSREQRQGIRYMWLLLAMHVAEDEGIEV